MTENEIKSYLDRLNANENGLPYPSSNVLVTCNYSEITYNQKEYLELQFTQKSEVIDDSILSQTILAENYIVFPIKINISYQITLGTILKDAHKDIGYIYAAKNSIDVVDISLEFYAAFLFDAEEENIENGYKLNKSYLVIHTRHLEEYITKYKSSSIIWGGFYHEDEQEIRQPILQAKTEIICLPNLKLPTKFHHDNAQRAIVQPYAFERFLKNYHLLELLFDYQVIKKIANYHTNDNFQLAGDALKKYKKEDIDRLKYILEKCLDMEKIANILNLSKQFQYILYDILYKYEKDNPALKETEFRKIMLEQEPFAETAFRQHNIQAFLNSGTNQNNRAKKLQEFTAYCIYRIRSSIAHSKIGEFLLTSAEPEHERFMVEFAEPLLQEVLIQCFTETATT
jgi:hypothetical protein